MSQIRAESKIFAAIMIVAAIGMASAAMDYSAALGPNGELGLGQPPMTVIEAGPFPVPDLGMNITSAVGIAGEQFKIGNFRNVPELSKQTLGGIVPVPERKPLG